MVTESVYQQVPQGPVSLDHQAFGHRNEEHVRDKPAAREILHGKVERLFDRVSMLVEPYPQGFRPPPLVRFHQAFARALWDGAARVERRG
jgi:hypothetical protein